MNTPVQVIVIAVSSIIVLVAAVGFAEAGANKSKDQLHGGLLIDNRHALYQGVMYSSFIAYNCDDYAGGKLANSLSGAKYWDDWRTYKKAAEYADNRDGPGGDWDAVSEGRVNSGSDFSFTFQHLNRSYSGDKLGCYGTETSTGGHGVVEYLSPSSREWRNDQEGEFSRVNFEINGSLHSEDGSFWIGPCFWFDQPTHGGPDSGWGIAGGGITDMVYYFTNEYKLNHYDYSVADKHCSHDSNPDESSNARYTFKKGDDGGGDWGITGNTGGPKLIVNVLANGHSLESEDIGRVKTSGGIPGPEGEYTVQTYKFKLCKGTRGYIQTNTGFTMDSDDDGTESKDRPSRFNYVMNPPLPYGSDGFNQPGHPDKEKFGNEDDPQDNSIHPFIVITEYTC